MIHKQTRTDRIIFTGVIGLLIFAPLFFGSVHVWAYTVVELGVFALLALWVLDRFIFSKSETVAWVKTPANLFLILLLGLIGLQLVPLPPSWAAFISPQTYADNETLYSVMARAGLDGGDWMALAYYKHPVVIQGLKLMTYLGMFFLVLNIVRSKKRMNILIYVLIFMGLFEALYAIYQLFSDAPRILWWGRRGGLAGRASGTYIVSNHFAGYLEMVIPLLFGFMIAQPRRHRRIVSGLGGSRAALQRFVGLFAPESASPRMIFFFFSALVMTLALLLSGSRGGILAMGIAMLGIAAIFFSKSGYRKYSVLAIAFCVLAFSYGVHIGIDNTLKRFEQVGSLEERLFITRTIVPMVKAYKTTGVGWGNFRYVYPRFSPDDFNRVSSSGHAHNDWIEALGEVGLAGGMLMAAAFIGFLFKMVRVWRNRRDLYALGVGAGVMAGILAVAFHSYFELNMHIPANPLTLAAILALGYAALHCQGRGIKERFFYRTRELPLTRPRRYAVAGVLLLSLAVGMAAAVRHFRAEIKAPTEWNSTLNLNWNPQLIDVQQAIEINPYNAEYHFKKAGLYMRAKSAHEMERREYNDAAISALETAVRLNPASEIYWNDLGLRYSLRSYDPYDYVLRWLPLAEICFDQAVKSAPNAPNILFNAAWYWAWRAVMLPEKPQLENSLPAGAIRIRSDAVRKFQDLFRRSLALNPKPWQEAVERVWEYHPDDAVVLGIVPADNEKLKGEVLKKVIKK
ncbi:MAG: O-antigen ligase family protein [Desulfobacterales bacterium]|nr:O-antigen ligase family protein [Desulfobacterales bacterium]